MTIEVLFASVPVTDLEAAVAWYGQLFGRPPDIVPNEAEVMWGVTDTAWLYLIRDHVRAGRTVVTISVSDLEAFVDELAGRGIRFGPMEDVGTAGLKATSMDADGNVISLIQVTPAG